MSKKKLAWEKYISPFSKDLDDVEFPGYSGYRPDDERRYRNGFTNLAFGDDDEDEDEQLIIRSKGIRAIATPFGFIPISDHNDICKVFDLWTVHTNFPVTQDIFNVLNNMSGVETLTLMTPYRFRIAIGKMFDRKEVKQNITKALCSD